MRITLHEPVGGIGTMSAETLCDLLLLVSVDVPAGQVARWTALERLLAYDYAIREHLAASDNLVRRRQRPSFLAATGPAMAGAVNTRAQWGVAYGGPDGNNCAGLLGYDDEAEAHEMVQWIEGGILVVRTVATTAWVNVEGGADV